MSTEVRQGSPAAGTVPKWGGVCRVRPWCPASSWDAAAKGREQRGSGGRIPWGTAGWMRPVAARKDGARHFLEFVCLCFSRGEEIPWRGVYRPGIVP